MDEKILKKLIERLKEAGLETKFYEDALKKGNMTLKEQEALADNMRAALRGVREEAQDLGATYKDILQTLQAQIAEISKQDRATNKFKKSYRSLTSEVQKLAYEEEGISELSQRQLEGIAERAKARKADLVATTQAMMADKGISVNINKRTEAFKNLTEEEKAMVQAAKDGFQLETEAVKLVEDRLKLEKELNKTLGLTGAALSAATTIANKFGMSHVSEQLSDISTKLRTDTRKAIKDNGNEALGFGARFAIASKGIAQATGVLLKGMMDPLFIIGKIFDAFLKVDKAAVDVTRSIGNFDQSIAGANQRLATSVDFLETASALTKQTGLNALSIFGPEVIANAAEFKNELGLSADEAGSLAKIAKTTGQSLDEVGESIVDTTSNFNKSKRAAVAQGQVLRDVANTSDDIKASLSNNPAMIAKAASAARRLGMELSDVDKIAASLMDFESSIESELEAQLLTGKNINMSKARELALNNDLAGLSDELFRNSASIAEFGKMNRIQQEAQAKALGMSRDQLAKMAYQKSLQLGMSEEEAAAAANVNLEEMKRMAIQEKLGKLLDKLAQAATPLLEILVPVVDAIGMVLKPLAYVVNLVAGSGLGKGVVAVAALTMGFSSMAGAIGSAYRGLLGLGSKLVNFFKAPLKGIKAYGKGIADAFKGTKDKVGAVTKDAQGRYRDSKGRFAKAPSADKAKEMSSKASSSTEKMSTAEPKSKGEGIKEYLTNLAEGLKAMGSTKVLGGALNLIPASIGFVAFIPGAVGAKLMEYLNGPKLQESLTGLAEGLKAMGSAQTIVGALALIPASLGMIGLLPALPVMYALPTAGKAAAKGLSALGKGLAEFGTLMMTGVGAIGLAAVVGSIVAMGVSLRLAAPAFEAFGNIIQKAFGGIAQIISATAAGFSQILDAVTLDKAAAMLALGPALLGVSAGLIGLSAASLFAAPGIATLGALSLMASPLNTLGSSLTVVASGIAAVATALNNLETEKLSELKDLVMTTAIAAPMVAATGAITELISGIAGTGGDQQASDTNKALLEEIKLLRAAVEAGGDVYIDGNKAGQALVLASTKLS